MTAHILVVDDQIHNTTVLQAKLAAQFFQVSVAHSGEEALEKAKATLPDLIILDVMMPGMDGYEVCKHLKNDKITANIPVIMLTALDANEDRINGLEAGADDFLTKPPNTPALLARVQSLLRLKTTIDELQISDGLELAESIQPPTDFSNINLLIIDHRSNIEICKKIQNSLNVSIHQINSEVNLSQELERIRPDMILLADDLKFGNGLALCQQLQNAPYTRYSALLTMVNNTDPKDIAAALNAGADDYVLRPIDEHEISIRIRNQLIRKHFADKLRNARNLRVQEAVIDPLTGLHNRRYISTYIANLLDRIKLSRKPLSLMIMDIDYFKQVNDIYGHPAGDEVLIAIAQKMHARKREQDAIARIGGEEFLMVMPDTSLEEAKRLANDLNQFIKKDRFHLGTVNTNIKVTISAGVSETMGGDSVADLLARADKALYHAKHTGRDCVSDAA